MNYSLPRKDLFDYLIAIIPACITAGVALIGYWQFRINKNKLRLDLYNKRFEIYTRTIDFYQILLGYDVAKSSENDLVHKNFIKACRESQFLFKKNSGIYEMLNEMHSKAFKIIGFKEHGKELVDAPDVFMKQNQEMQDALKWLMDIIPKLEEALAPYLDFHKITG